MSPVEPLGPARRCAACGHWWRPAAACVCGHLLHLHNTETKRRPCSTSGCGCRGFQEAPTSGEES